MTRILILSNPRSGSTLLASLLSSHSSISIGEEFLNDEATVPATEYEAFKYLEHKLAELPTQITGFKLFPEQLSNRSINFANLVNHLNITHVIVLWRENTLETLASLLIANRTGEWYSDCDASGPPEQVRIDTNEFQDYLNTLNRNWTEVGSKWPVHVRPIFVKFEDLSEKPEEECKKILTLLSCKHEPLKSYSKRLNPAPLQDKILNFNEIPENMRNKKFNAEELITAGIQASLKVPAELLHLVPDREPVPPPNGWLYRVAKPYINQAMKDYVADAMQSGIISSAGPTVDKMSDKLKKIFDVPVALPCSNGFSAIMIVLQAIDLKEGNEVILPSLTMVAVANAVHFAGGKPVFADCRPGNYNPGYDEILRVSGVNTKAVILTHTYGVPSPELERIQRLCQDKGWHLIEDISECVGVSVTTTSGKRLLGTFGDFACASLYANKIIQAGDGGFILCRNPSYRTRLTSLLNHGFTPSYHFVHFEPAINAKINGLGAAVCCASLDALDFVMEHRKILSKEYRNNLRDLPVTLMPEAGSGDTPWVFGLLCEAKSVRTALRQYLANSGIETRDFFFPLHLQPAYNKTTYSRLPYTEEIGSKGFYLPTYTELTKADIQHICNLIRVFFNGSLAPVSMKIENSGVETPDAKIEDYVPPSMKNGLIPKIDMKMISTKLNSEFKTAVKLELQLEDCFSNESCGNYQLLLSRIKGNGDEIKDVSTKLALNKYLDLYIRYFESQEQHDCNFERRPWLNEDLKLPIYDQALKIPTTTAPETLQFLTWVIKLIKPNVIWEIGTWLGHATARMAITAQLSNSGSKLIACDGFKWQEWMNRYLKIDKSQLQRRSFLKIFMENLAGLNNTEVVPWQFDSEHFPIQLCTPENSPELVYVDITQKSEELENLWVLMEPKLIPGKTIVVFNGFVRSSLEFFTRHADQLVPIAKPGEIAKAFRYSPAAKLDSNMVTELPSLEMLPRKLNFHASPDWSHHCQNAFVKAIDALRAEFHDPNAQITFVPAIEDTFSDNAELLLKPWVGIVHSVVSHPEFFYSPDLTRLCSREYSIGMTQCKGLLTLTEFQADYLKKHLQYNIPIQSIKYPMIQPSPSSVGSTVVEAWKASSTIDLVLIGDFARDFELFESCKIPANMRKVVLGGNEIGAESGITKLPRLSDEDYNKKLKESVVFLSLKYEGAANTVILECIARNVPILTPNFSSCLEYLGNNYPLVYDVSSTTTKIDLTQILTLERIQAAIEYLQNMDKQHLTLEAFVESVKSSSVFLSVNPVQQMSNHEVIPKPQKFDVTISICSYKRTKNLARLLESLWNEQDFSGTFQIILWNNNAARSTVVQKICKDYVAKSNDKRYLELIDSTENYYCSIRLALAQLMKSDVLLVVDDDIVPRPSFVSFFMDAHQLYPENILCVRGHVFLPHEMDPNDPTKAWKEYEGLRFKSESAPEQFVHFVHADTCILPKAALQECASVKMPDDSFKLVDDYWMSFVLNHKFGRQLRKLTTKSLKEQPFGRTEDSDTPGLALHTRPEVRDARVRLYVNHMMQGWPKWNMSQSEIPDQKIENIKKIWNSRFIGFNISSGIQEADIEALANMNVKVVRIGAVGMDGVGYGYNCELDGFQTNPFQEIERLKVLLKLLEFYSISAVLTLKPDFATAFNWKCIAQELLGVINVVGFDLINEPHTNEDKNLHVSEVSEMELDETRPTIDQYLEFIRTIREVDKVTPIIIEPTFWGHLDALQLLPMDVLLSADPNIIASFHFYEPKFLTQRKHNKGRFEFPGPIPIYQGKYSKTTIWDKQHIRRRLETAVEWANKHKVRIFLGEFGICRDIVGAQQYIEAIMESCEELGLSGFVFSFKDTCWDAMNYEFGTDPKNFMIIPSDKNMLFESIKNQIISINGLDVK